MTRRRRRNEGRRQDGQRHVGAWVDAQQWTELAHIPLTRLSAHCRWRLAAAVRSGSVAQRPLNGPRFARLQWWCSAHNYATIAAYCEARQLSMSALLRASL